MLTPLKKNPLAHTLLVLLFFTAVFVVFFAPVLASGRLLAPGDGTVQSLPNFYGPRTLWDEMIWGGFPAVADSQTMRWYPLTFLFSGLLGSWNVFVIVAYVLASCFAYGYAYTLTRSRLAALVSGIVYGMSGFLLVHLCHVVIIHAMAWLPLLLWSLENLRRRFNAGWFVAGCLAVAGSLLSGHPQIPAYTLCLAAAYVLVRGRRALVGRWRFYGLSALLAVLGLGLAAIQLIPTAELAGLSLRASLDFEAFVAYELPPRQLPMLLFPYLFGGSPGSLYGVPYFGAWGSGIVDTWGPTELSGYIGLLPPMLAAVGFTVYRRQPIPIFWLVVGVLSLLLALGSATPLAALVYHLPVLNKFRAPARHFAEMSLAVSVLAGYGALAITRELARRRLINRVVIAGAGLMLACLAWVLFSADQLKALAAAKGVVRLSLWPWVNPAVGVPLLVFAAAAAALLYWHRRPGSAPRRAVLVVVLVLDLASFGWFCEWRFLSPDKSMTETPDFASGYKDALAQTHQRLLPVRGALGRRGEFPPNVSKQWGLASAGGYGPLMLSRVSRALSMVAYGAVDGSWQDDANRSLDLFAVRYVVLPRTAILDDSGPNAGGVQWSGGELGIDLGPGCGTPNPDSYTVELPAPVSATRLGVVSALACAAGVGDGTEVVRVSLEDTAGRISEQTLAAGRDTSEWAYDCADVRPVVKHQRAPVFRSYETTREPAPCEGHDYLSELAFDVARPIKSVRFTWVGPAGAWALKKISLFDEPAGRSYPVTQVAHAPADAARWRYVGDTEGGIVYENLRAMPRAWLVPEVVSVSEEEALAAIRTSRLPGGDTFDPARTALVEGPVPFNAQGFDPAAGAKVIKASGDTVEVRTSSATASFLVLSDVHYPGWRAFVDGVAAPLLQADYALRGVPLPPGAHTVRLEFKPVTFYYGAAVSAASLVALMAFTFFYRRRASDTPDNANSNDSSRP